MTEETKYNLSMIVYDGINLFKDGEWTLLEFPSIEEGRHTIGFLETLTNEQIDHWIRVQTFLKESNQSFNALKYNKKYFGKTTAYEHKFNEDWKDSPGAGAECIQAMNVFEVQWSNCPAEVEKEVITLWKDMSFGNDWFYYTWDPIEDEENYPGVAAYLKSRSIGKCLIHWWW